MSLAYSISRFTEYLRRHGLAATVSRATLASKRALFAGRMAVFYCDLDDRKIGPVKVPGSVVIRKIQSLVELSAEHFEQIVNAWNPELAKAHLRERFEKSSVLWVVECEGQLAGYGWTIRGDVVAPYYFPLGSKDVQLFDFYVFPKFRGRAMHWVLTSYILRELAVEGCARAFADTGEWNKAQLAAFKMTPFRLLGWVKTYRLLGRSFSHWVTDNSLAQSKAASPARGLKQSA